MGVHDELLDTKTGDILSRCVHIVDEGTPPSSARGSQERTDPFLPPCRYWMQGRGCRSLIHGTCRMYHQKSNIEPNICHRYQRRQCKHQSLCNRIHADSVNEAIDKLTTKKFLEAKSEDAKMETTDVDPFVDACVATIMEQPRWSRGDFVLTLMDTLLANPTFAEPPLADYMHAAVVRLQNRLDVVTDDW